MQAAWDANGEAGIASPSSEAPPRMGSTNAAADHSDDDDIVLDVEHSVVGWSYDMRRAAQCIIPKLYLGSSDASRDITQLHMHGITTVLILRTPAEAQFVKPRFPQAFRYHIVEMRNDDTQNLISYVPYVCKFIDDARRAGEHVLVHDDLGISRAAAVVVLYLMQTFSASYEQALRHVQNRRFCIHLNVMFDEQCKNFEIICQARALTNTSNTGGGGERINDGSTSIRSKREAEFDEDDEVDYRSHPAAMLDMLRR